MTRVEVKPALLRWAVDRSRVHPDELYSKFPKLEDWERGTEQPTLRQLEDFARATHAPIGYLFLPTPPKEEVPLPDYRVKGVGGQVHPSPNLLDTIYACQQRQDWYREYARVRDTEEVVFVGSASIKQDPASVAAKMRTSIGFTLGDQLKAKDAEDTLRMFIGRLDERGLLVMVSGIVGTNTHRRLDTDEFRGFSIADKLAPLIFVNGADSKAAQMFTLTHELAHLWLGESSLDDVHAATASEAVEAWCNTVAAEFLVPLAEFKKQYQSGTAMRIEARRLAKAFKVSSLVALRRMAEAGVVTKTAMWAAYDEEAQSFEKTSESSGGNPYATQTVRLGKRFSRALVQDTREGNTLYRDAFRLSGWTSGETFEKWGDKLGVAA